MNNIFADFHLYNQNLAMSQVVRFFEQRGINVTKPMILGYIRDGLLPAADNSRYTLKHLVLIAIIDYYKQAYTNAEIRVLLSRAAGESDVSASVGEIYDAAFYERFINICGQEAEAIETCVQDGDFFTYAGIAAHGVEIKKMLKMDHIGKLS